MQARHTASVSASIIQTLTELPRTYLRAIGAALQVTSAETTGVNSPQTRFFDPEAEGVTPTKEI